MFELFDIWVDLRVGFMPGHTTFRLVLRVLGCVHLLLWITHLLVIVLALHHTCIAGPMLLILEIILDKVVLTADLWALHLFLE